MRSVDSHVLRPPTSTHVESSIESIEVAPVVVAARPRTLVLTIGPSEVAARMFGPRGKLLAAPVRISTPADPRGLDALWSVLEGIGEFDHLSVIVEAGLGSAWESNGLAHELQRQTGRYVRISSRADLQARYLRGKGVELVLSLAESFDARLYIDGTAVPGFALGRHPFSKKRTYQEYVSGSVLERKGLPAWHRRLERVARVLGETFSPAGLYIVLGDSIVAELPGVAGAQIVRESDDYIAAAALWRDHRTDLRA